MARMTDDEIADQLCDILARAQTGEPENDKRLIAMALRIGGWHARAQRCAAAEEAVERYRRAFGDLDTTPATPP